MSVIKTVKYGVETVSPVIPPEQTVIDTYHPTSSVCPWDYYGRTHQHEIQRVLSAAGIACMLWETRKRKIAPLGTGPGGMVRFGDDMLPGVYTVSVAHADVEKAKQAITAHRESIRKWLYEGAPMPEACKR